MFHLIFLSFVHVFFRGAMKAKYDEVLKWNVTNWKFMVCWILIKFILATIERFLLKLSFFFDVCCWAVGRNLNEMNMEI